MAALHLELGDEAIEYLRRRASEQGIVSPEQYLASVIESLAEASRTEQHRAEFREIVKQVIAENRTVLERLAKS